MALLHVHTLRIRNHGPADGGGARLEWVVALSIRRGDQPVPATSLPEGATIRVEVAGASGLDLVGWALDVPGGQTQPVGPARELELPAQAVLQGGFEQVVRLELRARDARRVEALHERLFWRLAPGPDGAAPLHAEARARLDEGLDSETYTAPRYLMYGALVGIAACFAIAFVPADVIWWFSGAELWIALVVLLVVLGLVGVWHAFWRFVAGPVEERLKKRHPIARVHEALDPRDTPARASARRHVAAFGAITGTRVALTASLYGLLVSALSALVAAVGTHLIALSLLEYTEHSVQMCMSNFIVAHVGSPRVNDSYARSLMQMRRAVATLPAAEAAANTIITACAPTASARVALEACLVRKDLSALAEATVDLRESTKGDPADILTLVGVLDDDHVERVSARLSTVQELHACSAQLVSDARLTPAGTPLKNLPGPKKASPRGPRLIDSNAPTTATTIDPVRPSSGVSRRGSDCSVLDKIDWSKGLEPSPEQAASYEAIKVALDKEGALLLNPDELQKHARAHCDPDLRELRQAEADAITSGDPRGGAPRPTWWTTALRALALLPFFLLVVLPVFVTRGIRRRLDALSDTLGLEEWADRVARTDDPDAP
jgi:hypothetical protein